MLQDHLAMLFEAAVLTIAALAGALAAITGFGIGSLLTPLLALRMDTRLAVALVAVPHVIGTALRFWLLSGGVDRRVLMRFGVTSAAGGLAGALLQSVASNRWLTLLFGGLLLFAAVSEATGLAGRMHFRGHVAWIAGALSGLLGGLVGNQGGLRSAALLGFGLDKRTFVATATAIGLLVDGARMPVYVATQHRELAAVWLPMLLAIGGVVLGTVMGSRVLSRIPDVWFHRVLAVVLAALGVAMVARAIRG
jgi:uncharacterized membrane protein YfcA